MKCLLSARRFNGLTKVLAGFIVEALRTLVVGLEEPIAVCLKPETKADAKVMSLERQGAHDPIQM